MLCPISYGTKGAGGWKTRFSGMPGVVRTLWRLETPGVLVLQLSLRFVLILLLSQLSSWDALIKSVKICYQAVRLFISGRTQLQLQ